MPVDLVAERLASDAVGERAQSSPVLGRGEPPSVASVPTQESQPSAAEVWQPKLLAFCCNWCTYAGADLAGLNRMKYPADVRLLRLPCSGRVNPQFILHAFQKGCDGVLVCGCHPGDCHYATGNYFTRRRMLLYRRFLEYFGIEPERFVVKWISGSEAGKFRDTVIETCEGVARLGPNSRYREVGR